jgi:hypothetical protein
MSRSAYALRERRRLAIKKGVAGALALALIGAVVLTAVNLTTSPVDDATKSQTPPTTPVDPGSAQPSDILTADTASPSLDTAITGLLSAERFKFAMDMRPLASKSKTTWRVTGEADLATAMDDPPRLHAQVAVGSGSKYSVVSEQIRVGQALYELDAGTGTYHPGDPGATGDLGAVDPVSTILASLGTLPASQFSESTGAHGTVTVLVRAGDYKLEGDITTMAIVLDRESKTLKSMKFRSKSMATRLLVGDLGDPSIDIQAPPA